MAKKNVFKKAAKKVEKFEKKHEAATSGIVLGIGSFSGCLAALVTDRFIRTRIAKRAEKKYQKHLAEQAAKAAEVTNSPEVLEEVPTF